MSDNMEAFMGNVNAAMRQQRRLQKSDDIIDFIKDHWRFFFVHRGDMYAITNLLGTSIPYTVDALCDQLGVPANVFFKRSPVADVGCALLNFKGSQFMKIFVDCCAKTKSGEACLFIVAGKKSICITNMQTTFEPGMFISYYKSAGDAPDIHVFPADDAAIRLQNLFKPTP